MIQHLTNPGPDPPRDLLSYGWLSIGGGEEQIYQTSRYISCTKDARQSPVIGSMCKYWQGGGGFAQKVHQKKVKLRCFTTGVLLKLFCDKVNFILLHGAMTNAIKSNSQRHKRLEISLYVLLG